LPNLAGPEALKAIRQVDGSVRIVVITGDQENNLLQEILELGPFTVLVKPFGATAVVETAELCT
jgi:DNA-binding NarL/FixJ family response regulator